jgi:hypothetical protein
MYGEADGRRVLRELSIRTLCEWLAQLKVDSSVPIPTRRSESELVHCNEDDHKVFDTEIFTEHKRRLATVRMADLTMQLLELWRCGRTDREVRAPSVGTEQ